MDGHFLRPSASGVHCFAHLCRPTRILLARLLLLDGSRCVAPSAGIGRILEMAGMLPDRAAVAVTKDTRMHCAALLSKIWDDTVSDQQRDKCRELCSTYFA